MNTTAAKADFPRYKYHLNLVQNIVHHAQQQGITITSMDLESIILIFGSITEEYRNLLKPLTFVKCACNGKSSYANLFSLESLAGNVSFNSGLIYFLADQSKTNVIKILLADTVDDKCKEISFFQVNVCTN